MASINFTIDSVSVLNPKLNHQLHNTSLSLLQSPIFHPLLKHNRTFKLSLQRKPLTVISLHLNMTLEVEVEKGNDVDLDFEKEYEEVMELVQELQEVIGEIFQVLTKKTIFLLKDNLEQLKIQANKAKHDLTIVAKEITEEGK
ncbi:hypothetical protein TSUD_161030 [Trifolium subterraneum]|uniref:Uncharacterized protein n=1 Tax=Trifolium subterraneum TaxID=3900 RepID=A0A2Z6NJT6_TRISU|nr:hypothetical protein TSUD_161030 [Trifolium subterraneum]